MSELYSQPLEQNEISPGAGIACAVIRQAINDGLEYSKIVRHGKTKSTTKERIYELQDGEMFLRTERLENFISTYNLGLDANHIRKIYKKIRQEFARDPHRFYNSSIRKSGVDYEKEEITTY